LRANEDAPLQTKAIAFGHVGSRFAWTANVSFLVRPRTRTAGHQPSLATDSFLASHLVMRAPLATTR
jgi:hypothetical protein